MDNMTFDLNRLFSASNKNGDSLSMGAYAGNASFVVFLKGSHRPDIRFPLTLGTARELAKRITKVVETRDKSSRLALCVLKWNRETKKAEISATVAVSKEDDGIIYLELNADGSSAKFPLRDSAMLSDGSNPVSAQQRSELGAGNLVTVLTEQLPQAIMLSSFNKPQRTAGGQGNSSHATGSSNMSTSGFESSDLPF